MFLYNFIALLYITEPNLINKRKKTGSKCSISAEFFRQSSLWGAMPTLLESPSLTCPGSKARGKKASLRQTAILAYLVSGPFNGTIKLHCFLESYCHRTWPNRRNGRKESRLAPGSLITAGNAWVGSCSWLWLAAQLACILIADKKAGG